MVSIRTGALILLSIALCHTATAATDPPVQPYGIGGYLFTSHDSEDFDTHALALQYLPKFKNGNDLTGMRFIFRDYKQNDWHRELQQVSFIAHNIDPATANGWQLETGISSQGNQGTVTVDGGYHLPLAAKTGLDLFINSDWVETSTALDRGITFTFVGASMDQGIGDHWTVIGMTGLQTFSDGNNREHYRAKLIFQPLPDAGLTLQLHYRTTHSSSLDVGGAYFNPTNYNETMLALGWRKRILGRMTFKATAGTGLQHVDNGPESETKLLELSIDGPYRDNQLIRVRGGYSRSASFGGADYGYGYLQGEWIVKL